MKSFSLTAMNTLQLKILQIYRTEMVIMPKISISICGKDYIQPVSKK